MRDIKIKAPMERPKERKKGFVPKDASALMRQKYRETQAKKTRGQEAPVQYATDRVEGTERAVVAAGGIAGSKATQKIKQQRSQGKYKGKETPITQSPKKRPQRSKWDSIKPEKTAAPKEKKMAAPRPQRKEPQAATAFSGQSEVSLTPARKTERPVETPSRVDLGRQKATKDVARKKSVTRTAVNDPVLHGGRERPTFPEPPSSTASGAYTPDYFLPPTAPSGSTTSKAYIPGKGKLFSPASSRTDLGYRRPEKEGPTFTSGLVPKGRTSPFKSTSSKAVTPAMQVKISRVKKMQAQMFRRTVERSRIAAQKVWDTAKNVIELTVRAAKGVASSPVAMFGGGTLLALFLVVALVAAIVASPFGIFFARDSTPQTVPVPAAIAQINADLNDRLYSLQHADEYHSITLAGTLTDWVEVLAVFSVKAAGASGASAVDVATMDADRVSRLKTVFQDMNPITSEVEKIDHPDSDPDDEVDDSWTEKILHMTITPKTAEEMATAYSFTPQQMVALSEILAQRELLAEIRGDMDTFTYDAREILRRLPDDLSPERRAVVEAACSLVGKVTYFWDGKSSATGWDDRWGQLQMVTEPDNPHTGTYRVYGLDCSGFVDWALRNAGLPSDGHWYIGTNLTEISQADALPGDIALFTDASHAGIVVGRDENGHLLVCHCSSSYDCVVISKFSTSGFNRFGKTV